MAFGWSAGDILSTINFIIQVASALDEVHGAPKEFRDASSFLKQLNSALTPLRTFTALETKPAYKIEITQQVEAIKGPIEKFVNDKTVRALQNNLGVAKEGQFRHLQNIRSKLKWHFSTSEKALALQKVVDMHLKIISALLQRLTVDMLHTLQVSFKDDVGKSLENTLDVQLPAFKATVLAELSQRDEMVHTTWQRQLETILERLLERYLGPPQVILSSASTLVNTTENLYTPQMLKESIFQLESRCQSAITSEFSNPVIGIVSDPEVTGAIQTWWESKGSEIIWIQVPTEDTVQSSIARDFVAMAHEANIRLAAYFCHRIDANGAPFDQSAQFVELLYSFICQICNSFINDISTSVDLRASRFSDLDGTVDSTSSALLLLRDLLEIISERVAVVIDGFEMLDYSNDSILEGHLKDFLEFLGNGTQAATIKTLITTEEYSPVAMMAVGSSMVDAGLSNSSEGFYSLNEFEVV